MKITFEVTKAELLEMGVSPAELKSGAIRTLDDGIKIDDGFPVSLVGFDVHVRLVESEEREVTAQSVMEKTEAYATDCAHSRDCRVSYAALQSEVKALEARCVSAERGRDLAANRL